MRDDAAPFSASLLDELTTLVSRAAAAIVTSRPARSTRAQNPIVPRSRRPMRRPKPSSWRGWGACSRGSPVVSEEAAGDAVPPRRGCLSFWSIHLTGPANYWPAGTSSRSMSALVRCGRAGARHRRRAGARTDLANRRRPGIAERLRLAPGAPASAAATSAFADPDAAAPGQRHRRPCQPVPSRPQRRTHCWRDCPMCSELPAVRR